MRNDWTDVPQILRNYKFKPRLLYSEKLAITVDGGSQVGFLLLQQKQVGEETVYSAYTTTSVFITKGTKDRKSCRAGT